MKTFAQVPNQTFAQVPKRDVARPSWRSAQRSSRRSEISFLPPALRAVQAKLTVGAADDPFEREADQTAERVMRMPLPKPLTPASDGGPRIGDDGPIRRMCSGCEEERVSRKAGDGEEEGVSEAKSVIGNDLGSRIHGICTGGAPLSEQHRSFFEPRFGHDFSKVRIHADRAAAETARSLRARAYTLGSHIAFGAGQYSPETAEGRRLLAHELTHVVQQGQAGPAATHRASAAVVQREPAGGEPVISAS